VVTHDLGLAWNIADRIAVMYLGRVVETGTTEEVLESPRHPYTHALLSVVPEIEGNQPVVLGGEIPDCTRIPSGCRFHPRCPALADGRSAAAGVDGSCRSVPLPILGPGDGRRVACHLDAARTGDGSFAHDGPQGTTAAAHDPFPPHDRPQGTAVAAHDRFPP
jgi:peptide/nickel transport system ATP-binding protein